MSDETTPETAETVSATLEPVARWRVRAVSDGPQGADGTAVLAESAWRNLLAAEWKYDHGAATMPAHRWDYAEPPAGQAFKIVYGYDAATSKQRSCAGAVCLTYRIPDGAFAHGTGQDAVAAATVSSVSAAIAVDRYCDSGAKIHAALSDSIAPPAFAGMASAASAATAWFPTSRQTGADGNAPAPNSRTGDGGTARYTFAEPQTPKTYLHLLLLLADYTGTRGAWIEGSAMFAGSGAATVEFSRSPGAETDSSGTGVCRMCLGVLAASDTTITIADALSAIPRVRLWANWSVAPQGAAIAGIVSPDWTATVENLLAYVFGAAGLYGATPTILGQGGTSQEPIFRNAAAAFGKQGRAAIMAGSSPEVAFCCLVAHGMTLGRVFRGIRFSQPVNPSSGSNSMPYRVAVYGISGPLAIGSAPTSATAIPWWGDAMAETFRTGKSKSLKCLANPGTFSGDYSAEIAATPLAARDVDGECGEIAFDAPWQTGEISTVAVALIPNGVPRAATASETLDASLSRAVAVSLPDSGAAAVDASGAVQASKTMSIGNFDCTLHLAASVSYLSGKGAVPAATFDGTTYRLSAAGGSTINRSGLRFAVSADISSFDIGFNGKTYSYVATADSRAWPSAEVTCSTSFVCGMQDGGPTSGSLKIVPNGPVSVSATAVASDGSSIVVALPIPGMWLQPFIQPTAIPMSIYEGLDIQCLKTYSEFFSEESESAFSATWPAGTAYAWADANLVGTVAGTLADSGTVLFEKSSKVYSAALPVRLSAADIQILSKGSTAIASGLDTTLDCEVAATLPARSETLDFAAPDGSRIRATVEIPAASIRSDDATPARNALCKSIALGLSDTLSQTEGQTVTDAVGISETGAEQTIDLGNVSLYE